jgi:hypothetical protein
MDPGFLASQQDLTIFLKEGYKFWEANAELVSRRFADPGKRTTVIIVHPDSVVMGKVAELDTQKTPKIQRSDCLETVRLLQMIRDVVIANGSAEAKESFDNRVTFIGHQYVPSWNGNVGDEIATVNVYDTGPAGRGPMASMTAGGAVREWALRNCSTILVAYRDDPGANLFNYQIPAEHIDLRAERTRLIVRPMIEQALRSPSP